MKQKLTALILVIFLISGMTVTASAELNTDVRNSVVVVSTCFDSQMGELHFGTGTGFFINDQYLVTNYHVVDTFLMYGSGEQVSVMYDTMELIGRAKIRAYFDSDDYVEAYIVGYDERKDIAILRLDKPTEERTPLKLKVPTEDMVGSTIYAVGYPGLADNSIADATESWGKNDATVTSGTISRLFTQSGTGQQNVQIDCDIKHGNSGGPVVTSDGDVIGVATWGVTSSDLESINYAVNISEVILLLNQYGVSYTTASDASQTEVNENPTPIVTPEPEKESNLPIILVSVAAVLVITGLVVAILLMKKKNAKSDTPAAPVAQPVVRSYSKTNYGAAANVSNQPILIGRGSNCTLRFPNNAPGVSGSHCTVQWDAATKDFIVTDMNSTYGTFLMSGQKMQPNQPYRLRAGDKFYLAEQSNTIGLSLE